MADDSAFEKVDVWADAFGVWHAKVNLGGGYGPRHLSNRIDAIRAKARRAIRREIMARDNPGKGWQCRIEVEANELDHMNVMHSITYAEKAIDNV